MAENEKSLEQEINHAIDVLYKRHEDIGESLVILSSHSGLVHASGNRFQVRALVDWANTMLKAENERALSNKFKEVSNEIERTSESAAETPNP